MSERPSEIGPTRKRWGRFLHGRMSRQLVILFLIFSFTPLLASNVWGYLQSRRLLTEAAHRDLSNMSELAAVQTFDFVRDKQSLVSSLVADNQHLSDLLRSLAGAASEDERAQFRSSLSFHLRQKAAEVVTAEEYLVADPNGELVGSSETAAHGDQTTGEVCARAALTGQPGRGFEYRQADEPSLVVATPIPGESGERLGMFCARFRFDLHRVLVATEREHSMGATTFVLNESGRVVCGSAPNIQQAPYGAPLHADDHDHGAQNNHTEPTSEASPLVLAELIAGGESWTGRYDTPSGEHLLAGFHPIRDLGWGVVVEVPVARALRGLDQLRSQAFALSGVLVSVLLLTIVLTSRSITRRLESVAKAAKRIAGGDLGERVPPGGPEELADLATAFNQMSLALGDSRRHLEERIAERTRELQMNQHFLELLLDSIDYFVVVIDPSRRVIQANCQALEMWGQDIIGREHDDVFAALQPAGAPCPVRRTMQSGEPTSVERWRPVEGGQEILSIETYPVRVVDGAIESVVQVGRVVTAEKQLQAQMVHHEKMAAVGLLSAGVAHEIGNPLAAIQSQLRMTRDEPASPKVTETLGIVDRQVARIGRLLRDLVDFSRRKRDEVTLVSLDQVIDDVVRLLSHDPRARNVDIERRLQQPLPGVRSKEDQILQVLLNLGINALDAMPEGGTLRFEGRCADADTVELRVTDQGSGISADVRPRVFEPFFTTKLDGRGTGLGLFVSRGIVEALGGTLRLERTGPAGTVFSLRLPVVSRPAEGAVEVSEAPDGRSPPA